MRRYDLRVLFFLLAISAAAFGQKAQVAKSDVVEQNLRKHVEYLASEKLEGRRTGEPGATLAAKYIAEQFVAIKLKPGFGSGKADLKRSYFQRFPYVIGVEMAKTGNEFQLEFPTGKALPEKPLAIPVGFSPNGATAKANIVFAGYGIISKDPVFDDYGDNDVRGKVVVVFDGYPDSDNPHSLFGRYDVRTKALIAKDKGAVGLLLISREDKLDDDRLSRLSYDQSLGEAALPTFVISRDTAARIVGIKTADLAVIESMVAMKKDTPGHVTVTLRDAAPTVTFRVNLIKKQADAFNVIGILPGTDPVLKTEAIVIGAHYDHLGHGGQGSLAANSIEVHHGADDNASGTAAVIELARQFAKDKKNKRTLIFICFSGEEEGLFGSSYYVNNPVFPLDKTIAMINMDMIGRLNENKLTIGGVGTASELRELILSKNSEVEDRFIREDQRGDIRAANVIPRAEALRLVEDKRAVPIYSTVSSKRTFIGVGIEKPLFQIQLNEDGFGPSDHSSFYGKKIPVLFFFTGTHNDYHKPSDTADKINYAGEANIISYIARIENSIDKNLQRPTFTVAKSSMSGGRTGFNISLGTVPNYADSTDGLLLDGVRDGSPAANAGVKAGDKVVRLAGKDVRNVMDYTYILGEMKAGEEYEIVVLRGGEKITLKIVPVKR